MHIIWIFRAFYASLNFPEMHKHPRPSNTNSKIRSFLSRQSFNEKHFTRIDRLSLLSELYVTWRQEQRPFVRPHRGNETYWAWNELIPFNVINLYLKGKDIKEEGGENWNKFDELLRQRQSGKRLTNDAFRQFVSQESQILRQNISLSST